MASQNNLKVAELASMLEVEIAVARNALIQAGWDTDGAVQVLFAGQASSSSSAAPSSSSSAPLAAPGPVSLDSDDDQDSMDWMSWMDRRPQLPSPPRPKPASLALSRASQASPAAAEMPPSSAEPRPADVSPSLAEPNRVASPQDVALAARPLAAQDGQDQAEEPSQPKKRKKSPQRDKKGKKQKRKDVDDDDGQLSEATTGQRGSRIDWEEHSSEPFRKETQDHFDSLLKHDPPSIPLTSGKMDDVDEEDDEDSTGENLYAVQQGTHDFHKVKPTGLGRKLDPASICRFMLKELRFRPSSSIVFQMREVAYKSYTSKQSVPSKLRLLSVSATKDSFKKWKLCNNNGDPEGAQPPRFEEHSLRPEQLRSLEWMVQRERQPGSFEVSYCAFQSNKHARARTDVRLQTSYQVRGGILADKIGYGKTATVIGLIDSTLGKEDPPIPSEEKHSFFPTKATLILVPSNLVGQWLREIGKFLVGKELALEPGSRGWLKPPQTGRSGLKILVISNVVPLKPLSPSEIAEADIVICTYRLLWSEIYLWRRSSICGVGKADENSSKLSKIRDVTRQCIRGKFPSMATTQQWWEGARLNRDANNSFEAPSIRRARGDDENPIHTKFQFPLLEQFWWRRIVFDEFHELATDAFQSKQDSLQHFRSHYRWGLTGTPPLHPQGVVFMSSLFRIDITGWQPTNPKWQRMNFHQHQCKKFLSHFVRQNGGEGLVAAAGHIQLEEHEVLLRLTRRERALYMAQAHDVNAEAPPADPTRTSCSPAFERLLKLCSHFQGDGRGSEDAEKECENISKRKGNRSLHAQQQVRSCWALIKKLEMIAQPQGDSWRAELDRCVADLQSQGNQAKEVADRWGKGQEVLAMRHASGDNLQWIDQLADHQPRDASLRQELGMLPLPANFQPGQSIPRAIKESKGNWQSFLVSSPAKALSLLQGQVKEQMSNLRELVDAAASLTFFQRTLQLLSENATDEARTCSVCLEDGLGLDKLAITPCSHVFCISCLAATVGQFQSCSICRRPLTKKDVHPVVDEMNAGTAESSSGASSSSSAAASSSSAKPAAEPDDDGSLYGKYGTKIRALVEKLLQIRSEDATAKIIVFTQWDDLKLKLRDAFQEFGLPTSLLGGGAQQRDKVIYKWQNDPTSQQYILLLSLEQSASGTNLTAANHVVLVHPMMAPSKEEAVRFEMQAIGRAWRNGQKRDRVHVWRFVTQDTVEEQITRAHRSNLQAMQAS
mmetsp:Transcript_6007/g.10792  ORF Transcript_6007/g.10792 Transcript_6007/m.10792 type:complete len:1231 (-) Transcript_6007:113-3805(-)|eukprot:CAMPEP_0197636456 /NCGR_PEP_ID=MMETSP1338-20131121/11958_1 /TAXON_ID=43686 ORGANISM="Pelagodinium beii, Strain RCC1491" /NCGR_SAMPLE_ID=MMETSP1338 /ASSEMBLY_ACC=CAM_ASM_000754 /LENGTH=1230 /DNA_ID=CAMNT_0043208689 /DNA_START=42 /DNA_END=3734 /DNA_ORIENTATION=-